MADDTGNGRAKIWVVLGPILLGVLNVVIGVGLVSVNGTLADIRNDIKDAKIEQGVLRADVSATRERLATVEANAHNEAAHTRDTLGEIKDAVAALRLAWERRGK